MELLKLLSAMIICLFPLSCEAHNAEIHVLFRPNASHFCRPQYNEIVISSLL